MNMAKAVLKGYGLQIFFDDVTEENVSEALNELINNPHYSEKAKAISNQFLDRPKTPQEEVVYWTEYAVKHRGATHLQGTANRLGFFELRLFDVYATMAIIFVVVLYINYLIMKAIIKRYFSTKQNSKKKEKRN